MREEMKRNILGFIAFSIFVFPSCGVSPLTSLNFDIIEQGMSKQYISSILRVPDRIIGTKIFSGIFVEFWEYNNYSQLSPSTHGIGYYWLYFFNGTLEKWGRPDSDNWISEAEKIIKLRYK
jgi:hypothetical protein